MYSEYRTLQYGVAWQTRTMRLFPTVDPSLPTGFQGYSAPLGGFVYDSGVTGAYIIQSVSGGGFSAPLTRDSGIHIDYLNGRVLVPKSLGTDMVLTGTASVPDFRFYQPNESEAQVITQNKYFVNPRYVYPLSTSGLPPNIISTPAVFINPLTVKNDPFEFGGRIVTKTTFSMTVFAESNAQLNAMLGLWADARYQYYPQLNTISDPIDQWGDTKGGTGWNYLSYVATYGQQGNLVYIDNVHTSKVSDKVRVNPQLFVGIIDVDTEYVRQSPLGTNIFV